MRAEGRERRALRALKGSKSILDSFESRIAEIGALTLVSSATSSAHP
jgi:hypothetical protein